MKITYMFLTKEEMEMLTTKRLLTYKKKLLKYHDDDNWNDTSMPNKSSAEWQTAYKNCKMILATREHVK